jgi:Rieske Fe-S protein
MGDSCVGTRFQSHHGERRAWADAPAGETRRDFIHIAAASVAAGGVAAVAWPFIQQLGPAADTRAASSAEVDVSKVPARQRDPRPDRRPAVLHPPPHPREIEMAKAVGDTASCAIRRPTSPAS